MATTSTADPATIEHDIRRTQENMSSTIDKIGDQLSIKNLFNALLDKADQSNIDARMLVEGARRNPIALGLIAGGAIWLVSDKDSKIPSLGSKSASEAETDTSKFDIDHRDYISRMSSIEQRADEEASDYQRRRDHARANYFMLERDHEEDDKSFRQRLDTVTDKFRATRHAWAESSNEIQAATKQRAQVAVSKAKDVYAENPLVAGLLATAIGAALGSAFNVTRQEKDALGTMGERARDIVSEQAEQVTAQVRETKDDLLDKADAKLSQVADSFRSSEGAPAIESWRQDDEPLIAGR